MTAQELIKLLSELPPDTVVFAWYDGERHAILEIDYWDDFHADFNLDIP